MSAAYLLSGALVTRDLLRDGLPASGDAYRCGSPLLSVCMGSHSAGCLNAFKQQSVAAARVYAVPRNSKF